MSESRLESFSEITFGGLNKVTKKMINCFNKTIPGDSKSERFCEFDFALSINAL